MRVVSCVIHVGYLTRCNFISYLTSEMLGNDIFKSKNLAIISGFKLIYMQMF